MQRVRIALSLAVLWFVVAVSFSGSCPPEDSIMVLECEPDSVNFGEVHVGSTHEREFTASAPMENDFGVPMPSAEVLVRINGFAGDVRYGSTSLECGVNADPFSVTPRELELNEFESSTLVLHFSPEEIGSWNCSLWSVSEVLETNIDPHGTVLSRSCGLKVIASAGVWPGAPVCSLLPAAQSEFGIVEVGSVQYRTLTIRNETPDNNTANQFKFLFGEPTSDCGVFTIDPTDTAGVLGPGESKDIAVRFAPDAGGSFECRRSLASLKEPADPADPSITNACPTEIVWRGTGIIGAPEWGSCAPGGNAAYRGVSGLSGSEVYVAGDGGVVLASGGDCQWAASGTSFTDVNLTDIWAYSTGTEKALWAVGNIPPPAGTYITNGAILTSDGSQWSQVDAGWLVTYGAVWGSGRDDVYFGGLGVSTDFPNAKHWNGSVFDTLHMSEMGMSEVTGVSGTASDDVWAVLRQPTYSVYHYDGNAWTNQTQGFMNQSLHDVWAVQGTGFYAVYAVGETGAIYHYDGNQWIDESIAGETRDFYGVWVSATGKVFVVGEDHVIYHWDGNAWTQQTVANLEGDLMDVWGASDDDVYAVGSNGLILRYALVGG